MIDLSVRENHELLAGALAHLGEGVMITDNNLERPGPLIVYANPALCRMSGYALEELVNQSPRIFQGPDTDKAQLQRIKAELRSGKPTSVELVNYRKNGERYFVDLFLSPIFDSSGSCTHYVSVTRDLTELKRIANTMRANEQHLRAVLNTAVDAIITIDQRGVIVSANRATTTMFGYGLDELLGQNVKLLMPEPFRREHDQYIRNYLETGHAKIIGHGREAIGLRKDGTLFPIDLSVAQVQDSQFFTGIIRDLTARRELQRQILEVASEKQRQIGFQLHEGLGQDLAGIALLANTLVNLIDSTRQELVTRLQNTDVPVAGLNQIQHVASRLSSGVDVAVANVDELLKSVMPVQLESRGLIVALRQLSKDIAETTRLRCLLCCDPNLELVSNFIAAHVYRIIRDAVENSAARPGVSQITISVERNELELLVEVVDDAQHEQPGIEPYANRPLISQVMMYRSGVIGAHIGGAPTSPRGHSLILRVNASALDYQAEPSD